MEHIGKSLQYFFAMFFIAFLYPIHCEQEASLKAGLIFQKLVSTDVVVNGKTLTLRRQIDVSPLYSALHSINQATTAFKSLCAQKVAGTKVIENPFPAYQKFDPADYPTSINVCSSHAGFLPEVRNTGQANAILALIIKYSLPYVIARISARTPDFRLVYESDSSSVSDTYPNFSKMYFKNFSFVPTDSKETLQMAKGYRYAYASLPSANPPQLVLRRLTTEEYHLKVPVICQLPNNEQTISTYESPISKMIVNTCKRDSVHLQDTYDSLNALITSTFNSTNIQELPENVTIHARPKRITTPQSQGNDTVHTRSKRMAFLPALAIGSGVSMLGGGLIHSSITGRAPLSFIGKGLSSVLGLATEAQMEATWSAMEKYGHIVNTLRLNIKEIDQQFTIVSAALEELRNILKHMHDATACYLRLRDLHSLIINMSHTLHILTGDLISAFADFAVGQYNPLLISPEDLRRVEIQILASDQLRIDISPHAMVSFLVKTPQAYYAYLQVPIISPADLATLYGVSALNLFYNGQSYKPALDTDYLLFFKATQEYSTMTPTEYLACRSNYYKCNAAAARIPVTDKTSCTATTFRLSILHCPLQPTNVTTPEFKVFGNTLIFSTFQPETLHVSCKHPSLHDSEKAITVQGLGSMSLPPDCALILSNSQKHSTTATGYSKLLSESSYFDILLAHPNLTDTNNNILYKDLDFQVPLTKFNFTASEQFDFSKFLKETFHYQNTVKSIAPVLLVFLTIFSILLVCCCCNKSCRLYLTTCCHLRPPNTWMQKVHQASQRNNPVSRKLKHWMYKGSLFGVSERGPDPLLQHPSFPSTYINFPRPDSDIRSLPRSLPSSPSSFSRAPILPHKSILKSVPSTLPAASSRPLATIKPRAGPYKEVRLDVINETMQQGCFISKPTQEVHHYPQPPPSAPVHPQPENINQAIDALADQLARLSLTDTPPIDIPRPIRPRHEQL